MMIVRRIVCAAVAAGVVAGGGVAIAPSAFAQTKQCGQLAANADAAFELWAFALNQYGAGSYWELRTAREASEASRAENAAGC